MTPPTTDQNTDPLLDREEYQPLYERLTQRQAQVLILSANGFKNPMIAYRLGITYDTVVYHAAKAQERLGAETMNEAIHHAHLMGLIRRAQ